MFTNNIFIALLFSSLYVYSTTASAEVIFSDSFESGDMSTTNPDGFSWDNNNRTSISTTDASCGGAVPGESVRIWSSGPYCDNYGIDQTKDWTAKTGKNSLRFNYPAGVNWSEQRFDMKTGYKHIYISYWIRVPLNFSRGNTDGGTSNNKWIWIGQGEKNTVYSKQDSLNLWVRDLKNGNSMDVDFQWMRPPNGAYTNSSKYVNFITPADAGRWMHIIYDLKFSSVNGAMDGNLIMYRKWEGESSYTRILAFENENVPVGSIGYNGWGGGYILGYANGTYENDTEWLFDDFTISTTSLLGLAPKSPSMVTVTLE